MHNNNRQETSYCLAPQIKPKQAEPPQQIFVATMRDDGTIELSIPGTAASSRRKLDTSFGLESAIYNELESLAAQNRWREMEAANKQAAAESARRKSTEQYLTTVHNRTYDEPRVRRAERATTILTSRLGPAAVRSMQERGELRILIKSYDLKPPAFNHEDVGV